MLKAMLRMVRDAPIARTRRPRPEPPRLLAHPPATPQDLAPVQRARIVPRRLADRAVQLGDRTPWWRDIYHHLLILPWLIFLLTGGALYLAANVGFALLYLLDPDGIAKARPGVFSDAFFFSIQTMATIGYGVLYPADLYTNLLVTAETLVALIVLALATGLFFARFSRPRRCASAVMPPWRVIGA